MEITDLKALLNAIEKRSASDSAKATYLECLLQNILESSLTPQDIVQRWIRLLNA